MFIVRMHSKARNIILITLLLIFISWKPEVFSFLYLSYSEETWKLSNSTRVIAFSPNSEMIALASGKPKTYYKTSNNSIHRASSTVEIRKVSNDKIIQTLDFPATISLAFSPDNKLIAIGGYKGEVKIYRIEDGKLVCTFKANNHPSSKVTFLAFTDDGQTLITRATGFPGQIIVWNFQNEKQYYIIEDDSKERYNKCINFSLNNNYLAIKNTIKPLTFYRLSDGSLLHTSKIGCHDIKFSSDGQMYVVFDGGSEGSVRIFKIRDNKLIKSINLGIYDTKELPRKIDLSPDGRYVAVAFTVASTDSFWGIPPSRPKASHGRIRIWNTKNGRLVATFRGHKRVTNAIAFSPDGQLLASAGPGSTIKFWKIPPRNYNSIRSLAFGGLGLAAFVYWLKETLKD